MNFIERKIVTHMVKAILERMLVHWKTSTAGIGIAALYLGVVANAYKPGMTWHDYVIAAVIAAIGLALKDPSKTASRTGMILIFALVCLPLNAKAQSLPPMVQHVTFTGTVSEITSGGKSYTATADKFAFALTKAFSANYQVIVASQQFTAHLGLIQGDVPLPSLLGKSLSSRFVFNPSSVTVSFFGGAGKISDGSLSINRIAETAGIGVTYPLGNTVSVTPISFQYLHGGAGIPNKVITTGMKFSF